MNTEKIITNIVIFLFLPIWILIFIFFAFQSGLDKALEKKMSEGDE